MLPNHLHRMDSVAILIIRDLKDRSVDEKVAKHGTATTHTMRKEVVEET